MREIKFRAWDKDSKVMREVIELIWKEFNLIAHCPGRGHEYSEWFNIGLNGWEYQLMKSTGLKDKNDVDIYEGDIVKYTWYTTSFDDKKQKNHIHKVFWSDWRGSWAVGNSLANSDLFRYVRNGNTVEVIGNIYENPELLEVEYE